MPRSPMFDPKPILIRVTKDLKDQIDQYAAQKTEEEPWRPWSRSDAIRALLIHALKDTRKDTTDIRQIDTDIQKPSNSTIENSKAIQNDDNTKRIEQADIDIQNDRKKEVKKKPSSPPSGSSTSEKLTGNDLKAYKNRTGLSFPQLEDDLGMSKSQLFKSSKIGDTPLGKKMAQALRKKIESES